VWSPRVVPVACISQATRIRWSFTINHTIATILSTTLVSTDVMTELNLIRIFVNN
jgi:hypothetical protein